MRACQSWVVSSKAECGVATVPHRTDPSCRPPRLSLWSYRGNTAIWLPTWNDMSEISIENSLEEHQSGSICNWKIILVPLTGRLFHIGRRSRAGAGRQMVFATLKNRIFERLYRTKCRQRRMR